MDPRLSKLKDQMVADQVRMNRLMFEAIDTEFKHTAVHNKPIDMQIEQLTKLVDAAKRSCNRMEVRVNTATLHFRICSGEIKSEDLTKEQMAALTHLILEEIMPDATVIRMSDLASGKINLEDMMRS